MGLYTVMSCDSNCGQHPCSHNHGYNHCSDCNDEDDLNYSGGIRINHFSCGGAKCRFAMDQFDRTPLYCIDCHGPENEDMDLQEYINEHTASSESE
jgi:hypothetical protein